MSRTVKGIAIYPDKRVAEVELSDLADYQGIVEGWIEAVTLVDGSTLYCNEEYRYKFGPHEVNWIASDVASLGGRPHFLFDPILGPVVIVGPPDDEGYDTDITDDARRWVRRVGREAGAVGAMFAAAVETDHLSDAEVDQVLDILKGI
jgi:hypothetical protein